MVEKLFETIKHEIHKYTALEQEYGKNDPMVKHLCAQIYGMQKAFAIITGTTYTDYLLNKLEDMVC